MSRGTGVAHARGLTLVELLVVIVIVATTATLVVQGIGQGLALFQRVGTGQQALYRELMQHDWIRQTLAAAAPPAAGQSAFTGGARRILFTSFRPLLAPEGIPTAVEWSLLEDGALEYREQGQTVRLTLTRPILRFGYEDMAGSWHEQWPPAEADGPPRRVRLAAADEDFDIGVLTLGAGAGDEAAHED